MQLDRQFAWHPAAVECPGCCGMPRLLWNALFTDFINYSIEKTTINQAT